MRCSARRRKLRRAVSWCCLRGGVERIAAGAGAGQGAGRRLSGVCVWRARELALRGFARNLSDGTTVEVVAEGPRASLDALLTSLREGPPMSYVKSVDVTWGEA